MAKHPSRPRPVCGGESLPIGHEEYFCLDGNVIWFRIEPMTQHHPNPWTDPKGKFIESGLRPVNGEDDEPADDD